MMKLFHRKPAVVFVERKPLNDAAILHGLNVSEDHATYAAVMELLCRLDERAKQEMRFAPADAEKRSVGFWDGVEESRVTIRSWRQRAILEGERAAKREDRKG